MSTVHFDCIGGASGNMLLGSLIDAGVSVEELRRVLLPLPFEWGLAITAVERCSLGATHVDVTFPPQHAHRHLSDIIELLSPLPQAIRDRSVKVFRRLAEAEARVHRIDVNEVHFHEVGAVDAIVDVAGTVTALHLLEAETVSCSSLPMGHGVIHCEHGTFPNPAPATAELLRGVPVRPVDVEAELVTPTAAAILTGLGARFTTDLPATWRAVGYGAGTRQLPFPNVVRAFVGTAGVGLETLVVLETNVDDTTPQVHGALLERLLAAGALDVTLTPVQMKKNRPAVMVTVLCRSSEAEALRGMLLVETSTLGVREFRVQRYSLPRREVMVTSRYGVARVKQALDEAGQVLKPIPEYDDCLRLATEAGVPLQRVLDEVRSLGWEAR